MKSGLAAGVGVRKVKALNAASLIPVTTRSGGVTYGLHSKLAEVQQLFSKGKLAVVANVGTLVTPVMRSQYLSRAAALPANLFSHLDQQTEWQTASAANASPTGWAGRVADGIHAGAGL